MCVNIPKGEPIKRIDLPLWIILATGLLLRWLHLLIISGTDLVGLPIIDSAFYHQWATAISRGDIIGDRIFFMSPLYPYVAGLVYAILGAVPGRLFAVQGLMSILTIWLLYRWCSRITDRRSGLVAAGLAAVYAPFIFYDNTLLTASLILLLSAVILNIAQDAFDRGTRLDLWKLGFAVGLSALARPLALMFLPFLLAGFYIKDRTTSLKRFAWVCAAVLIILLPVGIRNLVVGGEFRLTTSSGGMNFYVGNNPNATGLYWEAPFLTSVEPRSEDEQYRRAASEAVGRELSTREAGGYWMRKSLEWMINHPLDYLKLLARKAFYFWSRAEFANNISIYVHQAESPLLRFDPIGFWLIGPLGLAGMLLMWRRLGWRKVNTAWLWLAAYFTGALIFFVASEYRLPALLPLLGGAGFLTTRIADHLRARRFEPALGLVAFALLFMPLTNLRTNFIRRGENPRMDYFNFGNTLAKQGRNSEAISRYRRALEVDPYFEEALHRLADAYYRCGMTDKVIEIGRRVKLEKPENMLKIVRSDALREAYALLDEGKMNAAMQEFGYAGWDEHKAAAETTRVSRLYRARRSFEEGRLDETLKIFRQIRADDEVPDPSVSYNIAFLFFNAGELDSAEVYAREALVVDSLNFHAVTLLAKILDQTDRREEAEKLLRRVHPDASSNRALLREVRTEMDSLTTLGKWREALSAYGRYGRLGYEADPEDKLRLGRLQLEVGNTELALRLLTEAEAAGIHSSELYYNQGRALAALGRFEEAVERLGKAVIEAPQTARVRIELARVYISLNRFEDARRELEYLSDMDIPDPEVARRCHALWDSLKGL